MLYSHSRPRGMEVSQTEIKARTRHQILASETIHNWPNHADQTVNKAASGRSSRSPVGPTVRKKIKSLFSCIIQKFLKKFRHLHVDINLDEIKNTLHSLSVNCETNLMNLISQ